MIGKNSLRLRPQRDEIKFSADDLVRGIEHRLCHRRRQWPFSLFAAHPLAGTMM
jgi:hypothetical protein